MTEANRTPQESLEDLMATLADHQRQLDDLARAVSAQQRMIDAHEKTLHSRTER